MNPEPLFAFLHDRLGSDSTGHDLHHARRVLANAQTLARLEGQPFDVDLLEAAALLHDVLDHKFVDPCEEKSLRDNVDRCMAAAGLDVLQRSRAFAIWGAMGFRGSDSEPPMPCFEGDLILDADRLDAMGAVGIARCFAYGGKKGRPLYDPSESACDFADADSYRAHVGSSLNHFYEKLFHLRGRMRTQSARLVAEERHRFMEEYVDRFKREWEGRDL